MKKLILIFACIYSIVPCISQWNDTVPLPRVYENSFEVYVSENGIDSSNSIGSRVKPVRTFQKAFALLVDLTNGLQGEQYCAIKVLPGRYVVNEIVEQKPQHYQPEGIQGRTLNISFIGVNNPIIDGKLITRQGGYGLVRMCGSNIIIKGFSIVNAPSFGLVLGNTFARSTNVIVEDIIIDSVFTHGIYLGDAASSKKDTVLIKRCTIRETNRMNEYGLGNQWGSALKLYGASNVIIDSCYFYRNWSEAICINNSSNVEVRNTTVFDNWGPAVYCDIAQNVRISKNLFSSTGDSSIYSSNKRCMVSILLSTEAGAEPLVQEYNTENIDIYSNLFLNVGGVLDLWEGSVSIFQVSRIKNVRFANNSIFGLSKKENDKNYGIITAVYGTPFPFNRTLQNVLIYGNMFNVNPMRWDQNNWIRVGSEPLKFLSFESNRWNTILPTIGNHSLDDAKVMPDSFSITTYRYETSQQKKVKSLLGINEDYFGNKRTNDSTNAGAFEYVVNNVEEYRNQINPKISYGYFLGGIVRLQNSINDREFTVMSLDGKQLKYIIPSTQEYVLLPNEGPYLIIQTR